MMRKTIPTLLLATAAVTMLGGCNLIYRPDVQQGNLLIGKNVSELKPGLTKQQVLALLGTPSVVSPFDQNRWNYVATLQRRGGTV
ncbi:MAG TPA: outer membrane protein assembly factor BamE [Rhodanobacteraceae bacterium]|nr:outer membrane protein assembly factor BamE [Rhodanobacteraceae bacterium]